MKTGTHKCHTWPGLEMWQGYSLCNVHTLFRVANGHSFSLLSHHHLHYLLRLNVTLHTSAESVLVSISLSPVLSTPEWLVLCLQLPLTSVQMDARTLLLRNPTSVVTFTTYHPVSCNWNEAKRLERNIPAGPSLGCQHPVLNKVNMTGRCHDSAHPSGASRRAFTVLNIIYGCLLFLSGNAWSL